MATTKSAWFEEDRADGTAVAELADDLTVTLSAKDTMRIDGPGGASLMVDMEDASDLADALTEAVRILTDRGLILEPRARR
ncbi:hypothetical protein [Curtobacterium flaccumfaciens]|uniref:hypothetical protein n=1 Tax=Curtobacterium flaccumfaciens TaxID=2035 RepID=UPI003996451A